MKGMHTFFPNKNSKNNICGCIRHPRNNLDEFFQVSRNVFGYSC